ncbi:DUF1697 domain-containing protein [Nesterenkonia muleiensis]|uniref:DUF1697 domain-containing protein n=1 Tax=Nesterenkonia muleiensis TaxID=2282648 RepID=UPI000E74C418|nr:DUF1697 domain-containing protein [Nesterenkonia muleiensis]
MTSYCALLRGIGPGNPNMRNDRLREVFEHLGFADVASVLSSGNILFSTEDGTAAPELEDRIQSALHHELGIGGGTILRSRAELETLVAREPFGGLGHSKQTYLTVTFLKEPLDPAPAPFPVPDTDQVRIQGYDAATRAVLAVVDTTGIKTPDYMSWLERTFSNGITTRTWNTVTKILKKLPAG